MQGHREYENATPRDEARLPRNDRRQRTEELRSSRDRALGEWLAEFAHLEIAGFRSHVTTELERRDLAFLLAGETSRFRGVYPHESTPWSFALTAYYLRAPERPATETPIRAILAAVARGRRETRAAIRHAPDLAGLHLCVDRTDETRAIRWLASAERLLAQLADASEATLFEQWLAQTIYCTAQRNLVDTLAPDISRTDEALHSSRLRALRDAAEAGDQRAAYAWGLAELNGIGKQQRPAAGVRWLEHAATLGHAEAQYELGTMYAHGWSVPRDEVVGLAWFLTAERAGHAQASQRVETLAARLSTEAVARAQRISGALTASSRGAPRA